VSNADLLGDPAALSSSQRARVAGFRTSLFSNPAITQLRLIGDAMRASPSIPCKLVASINADQPTIPVPGAQTDSLFAQTISLANSTAMGSVENTVAGIANGLQNAALLAVPGLFLATLQPLRDIERLQLSGVPVPTGFWSVVGGVVGGAIVGAAVGFAAGGPYGAIVGAVVGGAVGGITCAASTKTCDKIFGDDCQQCD